jgi:type IV pilus assembly protein PilM
VKWLGLSSRTPIGIDIGSRYVKAAQLSRSAGGWRVGAAAFIQRSSPDAPVDPPEIRRLCDVLYRQGFCGTDAVVMVPRDKLMTGMLELPSAVSGAPLQQIARVEFARMHSRDPQSFEMVYWDVPKPTRGKEHTQVLATACAHDAAESFLDVLEEGGLNVEGLDTNACALQRACAPLLSGSTGISGILDVGWSSCNVIVLHSGVVIYERSLPEAGIGRLHKLLEEEFHLEGDETDVILRDVGLSRDAQSSAEGLFEGVRAMISAHFDQAMEDLRAPFFYALQQYSDSPIDRLLLVGGGASIASLPDHLGAAMKMSARAVTPVDLAECPSPLLGKCGRAAMTGAIGLARFSD